MPDFVSSCNRKGYSICLGKSALSLCLNSAMISKLSCQHLFSFLNFSVVAVSNSLCSIASFAILDLKCWALTIGSFCLTGMHCCHLSEPANGRLLVTGQQYQDQANYACNEGYRLEGSSVRTCQVSGAIADWSGRPARCVRKLDKDALFLLLSNSLHIEEVSHASLEIISKYEPLVMNTLHHALLLHVENYNPGMQTLSREQLPQFIIFEILQSSYSRYSRQVSCFPHAFVLLVRWSVEFILFYFLFCSNILPRPWCARKWWTRPGVCCVPSWWHCGLLLQCGIWACWATKSELSWYWPMGQTASRVSRYVFIISTE